MTGFKPQSGAKTQEIHPLLLSKPVAGCEENVLLSCPPSAPLHSSQDPFLPKLDLCASYLRFGIFLTFSCGVSFASFEVDFWGVYDDLLVP